MLFGQSIVSEESKILNIRTELIWARPIQSTAWRLYSAPDSFVGPAHSWQAAAICPVSILINEHASFLTQQAEVGLAGTE